MTRLFTSEADKHIYSPELVILMNAFYDGVDAIQEANKNELPTGISLDNTFEFNFADKDLKGIEFNNKYDLPQHIMNSIWDEFKDVFKRQV